MEEIGRLNIFVGGTGDFNKYKNLIKKLVSKYFQEKIPFDEPITFRVTPKTRPDDDGYQKNDAQSHNTYALNADLLFMFFENGLGTRKNFHSELLSIKGINELKSVFDKNEKTKHSITETGSVCEILYAISGGLVKDIHLFFKKSLKNETLKAFETELKTISIPTSLEYEDLSDLENDINFYLGEKLKSMQDEINQYKHKKKTKSLPIVFPSKIGTNAYENMLTVLPNTKNILSFNLKSDLPDLSPKGPRSNFSQSLRIRLLKNHQVSPDNKLYFTRISSFSNLDKVRDAIEEIEILSKSNTINLLYYPFMQLDSNFTSIIDTSQIKTSIKYDQNDKNHSEGIHENPSLVLFGSSKKYYEYDCAYWGLYGDHSQDGKESPAILFRDLKLYFPLKYYAEKLKEDFERNAPLFITYPDREDYDHDEHKKEFEGLYVSNFYVLTKYLEIYSDDSDTDSIVEKLCSTCKVINKMNFCRRKLSMTFKTICEKVLKINENKIICQNCTEVNFID